ncbi:MAG: hypothetical protein Rubg2KO_13640 [Rubricoccaceae bacterium]
MTQLESYAQHYKDAQALLHSIADDLSDEAFNWKPDAKSWSVGECVVHLNKISKGYLDVMEDAAAADSPRAGGPFTYGWLTRTFIKAVRPGSRSMSTAPAMKPPATEGARSAIDKDRALASYDVDTGRYLQVITEADGLDLGRIKVASPFLPIARFKFGGLIEALGLHAMRHVQQAERVTRMDAFPGELATR